MSRPETTIFGSLSSKPASGARSLGDFSRTSNPPPSGGGEWDPSQENPVNSRGHLIYLKVLQLTITAATLHRKQEFDWMSTPENTEERAY